MEYAADRFAAGLDRPPPTSSELVAAKVYNEQEENKDVGIVDPAQKEEYSVLLSRALVKLHVQKWVSSGIVSNNMKFLSANQSVSSPSALCLSLSQSFNNASRSPLCYLPLLSSNSSWEASPSGKDRTGETAQVEVRCWSLVVTKGMEGRDDREGKSWKGQAKPFLANWDSEVLILWQNIL